MTDLDHLVAGVSCRDVLADLSEFLDGALSPERVAQLQAHLAGCANCARFGSDVAATLTALRAGAAAAPVVPTDVAARLRDRMATLLRDDPPRAH